MNTSCWSESLQRWAALTLVQACWSHLLGMTDSSAVDSTWTPVCRPIFWVTMTFCTTSSRVGHRHSAWGVRWAGSTRLSMASTKQVVFPLPLWACRGTAASAEHERQAQVLSRAESSAAPGQVVVQLCPGLICGVQSSVVSAD